MFPPPANNCGGTPGGGCIGPGAIACGGTPIPGGNPCGPGPGPLGGPPCCIACFKAICTISIVTPGGSGICPCAIAISTSGGGISPPGGGPPGGCIPGGPCGGGPPCIPGGIPSGGGGCGICLPVVCWYASAICCFIRPSSIKAISYSTLVSSRLACCIFGANNSR